MTADPIVVARGGNALLRRGEPTDTTTQRRNVARATRSLAALAARGSLVVTHGNGPQVGLLALQAAAYDGADPYPLDVLGAESEGMIGYLLEQEPRNALARREVATLLTQVVVDPDDHAFAHPTRPIGPTYNAQRTAELRARGWTVGRDGTSWRRVFASPEPQEIVELSSIRLLVAARTIVISLGGDGIPVTRVGGDGLRGVEAVIDKDLAAALLAVELDASALVLLTDVTAVHDGWSTETPRPIRRATPDELRARSFPGGSMGPKVEAAARFADETGRAAAIGALDESALLLDGVHGTTVTR